MSENGFQGLDLRSLISADGQLRVSLEEIILKDLAADEIIVRVEATPLNPSDVGLLLGPADLATARGDGAVLTAAVPQSRLPSISGRIGMPLPVGNEGAGTVVAAGDAVQDWLGKRVGMLGGAMYAQYRKLRPADCLVLPDQASMADGASMSVNPLTSLAMVETMRREGHTALVHTAAASNLGQMLVKICLADGVELVNIVRSQAQANLLREIGAVHVVDSSATSFEADLAAAIVQTKATIAFDAVGGGTLANSVLHAMEASARRDMATYSRYGSDTFKQVYIYGGLDTGPTKIDRGFGFSWSVGAFLIMPFLTKVGSQVVAELKARVVRELTTTFASRYSRTISLRDVLKPEIMAEYAKRMTGEKFLINPTL